jgi:hypothetical protein
MSEQTHEILPPTINRTVEYHPAEHEYFLSFANEVDASLFHSWWQNGGFAAFKKWAEKEVRDFPESYR